jgi:CheY-like chemotaxis protein/rubrerythrin
MLYNKLNISLTGAQERCETVKEIIPWLIDIESSAADLYAEVADAFRDDGDFSRFLALMSAEEREHANLLQQARAAVPDKQLKAACFYFDDHFRKKIEAPFVRARDLLANKELTKSIMVDILAEAEFSEWNEIFLYTLDTLKVIDEDVQKAIADIDQHRKHVQEFILSLPGGDSLIQRARRLSRTGGKRALIVEDNHAVARMLEALVGEDVEVIIAHDGLEGIVQIREGHFDLIVANIEMPEMNGIEMYKQALAIDHSIGSRFMFFTGTDNPEYLQFVRDSQALMLPKPSPVKVLCEMMNKVLDSTALPSDATIH